MRTRVVWLAVVLLIGFVGLGPGHAQEIENLLANGGFEEGVMTPWTTYGGATTEVVQELVGATVPEDPIEGDYCLHIVVPSAGANYWDFGLKHAGHLFEAGKKYTLSAFLKCNEGTLQISFKPELDQDPWTGYGSQQFTMTEEWAEYSITTPVFTEDVSPTDIMFHIGFAPGDFWIDNVRFYEGDYVSPGLPLARDPVPATGSIYKETWASLEWQPGDFAVSHDVYFGESFADVDAGTGSTFQSNQDATYFLVGLGVTAGDPYPDGLVAGTTYYWRIDEVNDLNPDSPWKGNVWSFLVPYKKAFDPYPADGSKYNDPAATLSWEPGMGVILHHVYFGDNPDDVAAGTGGTDKSTFGTTILTYDPGALELDTTYYWRVDEFDGTTTHTGNVWSFTTTIPSLGKIGRDIWENIPGSNLNELKNNVNYPGNPTWSDELTSFDSPALGLDNYGGRIHGWLYVPAAGDYTFWVAGDDNTELWLSTDDDPGNVRLIASVPDWTDAHEWEKHAIQKSKPITLESKRYYIMALWKQGGGGDNCSAAWQGAGIPTRQIISAINISPYEPTGAFGPGPGDGAMRVSPTATLTWKPGERAASHQVYVGTDENAVKNATTASPEYGGTRVLGSESFEPGKLAWESTYYWRIDEVNNTHPDSPWVGSVWSFTTANYLILDDFEAYGGDQVPIQEQMWFSWHDGAGYGTPGIDPYYAGNGTGATVGDEDTASFTEEGVVHAGQQAMPYWYNNNAVGKFKYSEAAMRMPANTRDWSEEGIKALSLWFRGNPGSVGGFVEAPAGTYTMTASGADITGPSDEFHYAYKTLTGPGTIVARVESVEQTDNWAKAGVMIRETLDPDSAHAMAFVTPAQGAVFEYRPGTGEDNVGAAGQQTGVTAPYWVRIERDIGGTFTASHSRNGSTWQTLGTPINIQMNSNIYIGLAVTAHNANATCQAVFSNVTITGSAGPQWMHQDIGILSNAAEPMYVALANSAGAPAVVYHDDPSATQIDTWTEWNVDLKDFADQGINLADVDSLAIGFGDRNNPQPGGSGKMYFDEIRLYRPRYIPGMGTPLAADFNGDGIVDFADLQIMAGDWLVQDAVLATANPTTANLVAYYALNEGAGTVAADSAGANNGTVVGGALWVAGPDGFGGALHFDGTSQGQYVDLGTFNPSSGPMTVALWAKWDGLSGFYQGLIGKRDTWAAAEMMWQIEANRDTGALGFFREGSYPWDGDPVLPVGQWAHVAASFDGTDAVFYFNGVETGRGGFSYGDKTDAAVVFGACQANGVNPFNGALDEIRIYNRALNAEEVAYLIANGAATAHVPVPSAANITDDEPQGSQAVNFKDYALLVDQWLDEQLWPEW